MGSSQLLYKITKFAAHQKQINIFRQLHRNLRLLSSLQVILLASFIFLSNMSLALSADSVEIELATAPKFVLDHNNQCDAGPTAAYVGIRVRNISINDTISGLTVSFDSLTSGSTRTTLLGPSDSILSLSSLAPGNEAVAYFYFKYPCVNAISSTFYFSIKDDSLGSDTFSTTILTETMISASAAGEVVARSTSASDVFGGLLRDTVTYEFGNVDKITDVVAFSPNGDTTFNADELILLRTEVIESDLNDTIKGIVVPIGSVDKLYFTPSVKPSYNGGAPRVKVVYTYRNQLTDSTIVRPYAYNTSGTQDKYTGNFGTIPGSIIDTAVVTDPLIVERTLDKQESESCDTITYTVDVINTNSVTVVFDRLIDSLPEGYSYLGLHVNSEVNATNVATLPQLGDSNFLTFEGFVTSTTPFYSLFVEANDTLSLLYDVKIGCHVTDTGNHISQTTLELGTLTSIDTAGGCTNCSPPVPVKLIRFNGELKDNLVELKWVTASELNNHYFELSRSFDGKVFEQITTVDGQGNTNNITEYSFTDMLPVLTGNSVVYKLKQVDYNGESKEFFTQVNIAEYSKSIVVRPNPFDNKVTINNLKFGEKYEVEIIDVRGTIVWFARLTPIDNTLEINFSNNLAPGQYLLNLKSNESRKVKTFKINKS